MTLLCGSFHGILEAIQELELEGNMSMFDIPNSIIPVNIGGFSAWIVQINRTDNNGSNFVKKRNKIRKLVKSRSQSMHGMKKRLQS